MIARALRLTYVGLAACASLLGCGASANTAPAAEPAPAAADFGPAVAFRFKATDGSELTHATVRGRATAIVFITTYDTASQLQARHLEQLLHTQRPRINAVAIVLEADEYSVLADVFRQSLRLTYPVALADAATRAGHGPFGKIDRVPTTIVLDRSGRIRTRVPGVLSPEQLAPLLSDASE